MKAFIIKPPKPGPKLNTYHWLIALSVGFISKGYANTSECRMFITATNDTGTSIAAALFNEQDERVSIQLIPAKANVTFSDLCAGRYKIVFKDGIKYTETDPIAITYTTTVIDNSTRANWTNGSAKYFVTKGRSSGRAAAERYRF